MNSQFKNKFGFTLIEIMIAVAILVILASVGIIQYNSYIKRTRVVNAVSYTKAMADKMMLYYVNNQDPPSTVVAQEISKTLLDSTIGKSISDLQFVTDPNNLPAGVPVPQGDVKFIISAKLNSNLGQESTGNNSPMLYMVVVQSNSGEYSTSCTVQGTQGATGCNNSCLSGPPDSSGNCTTCANGTYFDVTSNSYLTCTGTGGTCSGGTISCPAGQYLAIGSNVCSNCEGTISGGVCTTCSPPNSYWNGHICTSCPVASCVNNIPDCSSYGANYYWNTGSGSVQLCKGTLSVNSQGVQQCTTCSGSTPYYNNGTCTSCPQGLNCPGDGSGNCPVSGQYYNGSSCVPCQGTLSGGICTPCTNGTFWDTCY